MVGLGEKLEGNESKGFSMINFIINWDVSEGKWTNLGGVGLRGYRAILMNGEGGGVI